MGPRPKEASLEPRPSDTASRLQQRLGPAHRFYAKQVLQANVGVIFRTSFRVRPELCAGSPPHLTAGFAAAFVQTSLGWAVQALDASGRGALVAERNRSTRHKRLCCSRECAAQPELHHM